MHSLPRFMRLASRLIVASVLLIPTITKLPTPADAAESPANGQTWAFDYAPDAFTNDAALDLRHLNEKEAGQSGFVKLAPDGNHFALGNGTPVRFWAVNTTIYRQPQLDLERQARFLAKIGVNMVRMHGSFAPKGKDSKITDVDEAEIDRCWRLVAAMKKQGIYTTISPYWANGGHTGTKAAWGIDGYGDGNDLWGVLFFNDTLRNAYKAWVKALYTRKNPYTGIPLAQDPAVGIIQVQNEDSLFFWTTQGLKPPQMELLRRKYAQWLIKKYGALEQAKAAWGGYGFAGDDFANNQAGIMNVWQMTQPQTGGAAKRLHDEIQFFAETQRDFYSDIANYYRNELGCKQLINACNWITADPEKLNDLERWTYTPTDVFAVNKYYNGGPHVGENNGWRIDPGHYFGDQSALLNPTALPTNLKQVVGHPMLITESSWVSPLGYQSEGPFLMAAYQSLSGVDNFYWFSADNPAYNLDPFLGWANLPGGQHPLFKWSLPPAVESSFPAAALMYRLGYIQRGATVVHEERTVENLYNRTTPIITEGKTFDPNRDKTNFAEGSPVKTVADPLAFLVGRVEVRYGGDPAKSQVADLSRYIDNNKQTVTSTTGEINLNHGIGVCTLNAPKAQGATGFLNKAGEIRLKDITIRSNNEYATVTVVPLDDKPLGTSQKVLVQIGTMMRPTGWIQQPADFKSEDGKETYHGYKIVSTGKMPWQVANTDVTLTVRNPNLKKATLLDAAGYRKQSISGTNAADSFTLQLPSNALYAVLE